MHGIVIQENTGEIRAITSPSQSIVGIVGSADGIAILKDNEPQAFFTKKEALAALTPPADSKKAVGSLYHAVVGVHEQTEDTIVLVKARSETDADMEAAIEALLDAESVTGYKPKVIIATRLTDGTKEETPNEPANPKPIETNPPPENRSRTVVSKATEVKNN